jgi:hypothetical protein
MIFRITSILIFFLSAICSAAYRDATAYGAKGDKVTDDYPSIQAALIATKEGDIFRLPRYPGGQPRTYRISRGLVHTASRTQLLFNGNTLLLDTAQYPFNTHLTITSPIAREPIYWEENIKAGWYTPPFDHRPAFIGLGTDPFDPAEEFYQVFLNTKSTSVYLNKEIIGKRHSISPLKHITEDVVIKDFRADHTDTAIPDVNISFYRVRSVQLDGLTGRTTIGVSLADVQNALLSRIDVDLSDLRSRGHTASNRAISIWGSKDIRITDLTLRGDRSGGIMVENQSEAIQFDSVKASFTSNKDWFGDAIPLFMIVGNSQVKIKKVYMESNSLVYPNDRGGQDTPLPEWESLRIGKGWPTLVWELERQGKAPWGISEWESE